MSAEDDSTLPIELTAGFRADVGRMLAAALGQPTKGKMQVMLELAISSLIASGIHPDDVHAYCAARCADAFIEQALGARSHLDGSQLSEDERSLRLLALLLARAGEKS